MAAANFPASTLTPEVQKAVQEAVGEEAACDKQVCEAGICMLHLAPA